MRLAVINAYIGAHVLLIFAAALLVALDASGGSARRLISYRRLLQIGRAILITAIALPLLVPYVDRGAQAPHAAEAWSAPTMRAQGHAALNDDRIALVVTDQPVSVPLSLAAWVTDYVVAMGLLVIMVKAAMDAVQIARVMRRSQLLRRTGRLRILVCDTVGVPFSFWIPGQHYIVVTAMLLTRPDDLRMVIRHEGQHHRQGDTKFLYLCLLIRALFGWNPAVHYLMRTITQWQELAVDEAVIMCGRSCAQAYCQSLVCVAEAATRDSSGLLRAGMAGGSARFLTRRIEAVLGQSAVESGLLKTTLWAGSCLALLAMGSLVLAVSIQDRRVSQAEAAQMASRAQRGSAFEVIPNERVRVQLNLLLGTPDGRAFLRASLKRMAQHRAVIAQELERYRLPPELIAVPLLESGYENRSAGKDPRIGAGLWMFIESTARRYGLEMTPAADRRLDVVAETNAAARLLSNLQRHFDDWSLTLLAFNVGVGRVDEGIRKTGSRDVWQLIAQGYENDPDYLPRALAIMVILGNPAVVSQVCNG
jgi:beta-lactamase regulating signal transducer with metallopeptidase domain